MKYVIAIFVTAVVVFLGATIYYKGLPVFPSYNKTPASTESAALAQTPNPLPVVDESEALISAMRDALIVKHGTSAGLLNITVSKMEGDYASGGASGQGGGGMWFAAKVGEIWKLVWDGNGIITCTDIAPYPLFPKDLIPECWNTNTDKMVIR